MKYNLADLIEDNQTEKTNNFSSLSTLNEVYDFDGDRIKIKNNRNCEKCYRCDKRCSQQLVEFCVKNNVYLTY